VEREVIKLESLLDKVFYPEDIKKLSFGELEKLAGEIRNFLLENVSRTGGHIASNLGVVELTLALHKVFNTPKDKIVWDVGHQTYVHKILTGRKNQFETLRKLDGLAGFPKVSESNHDCFNTGHSSTSISAALGIAKARDLKKEKYSVIAVIGDGALTGGMAFEALNDAGQSSTDLIVVLNDNEMSITKNVGGLSKYLSKIRTEPIYFKVKRDLDILLNKTSLGKSAARLLQRAKGTIKYILTPGIIFEELGFKYLGPIDGHNIHELTDVLERARNSKGPVLIHICTQKGKGYSFAEKSPDEYHGIAPFEIETGEVKKQSGPSFSEVFGKELLKLAQDNKDILAITAAMLQGTGLTDFSIAYPERFFDVGIAEQHAVTFAAGLASNGLKPVVAIYSSFLQRAYDQILHDVALQKLHVVFGIDRAGITGEDGETHQGLYDICYLRHIPGMTILAPVDYNELRIMLKFALTDYSGPIAIRYPRGTGKENILESINFNGKNVDIEVGKGLLVKEGKDITIIGLGNMFNVALEIADKLEKNGISVDLINPRFVKPLDKELILSSAIKTGRLVSIEDGAIIGGFGSSILELLNENSLNNIKVKIFGFPDEPIPHGSRESLFKKYKMDQESILEEIKQFLVIDTKEFSEDVKNCQKLG